MSSASFNITMSAAALLPHLAAVARECRQAADATVWDIADAAGVNTSTVYRFERGCAWPKDPDMLLAAYGVIEDCHPAELWERALRRWRQGQDVGA